MEPQQGGRIHFSWVSGSNAVRLCETFSPAEQGAPPPGLKGSTVYTRPWNYPSGDERKLAHDALALFTDVHKDLECPSDPKDRGAAVLQYSRNISYAMGRLDETANIPDQAANIPDEPSEESISVAMSRAVWELLEIFYVDPNGALLPTQPLAGWLRRNATSGALAPFGASLPGCYAKFKDTLIAQPQPELVPEFWECLYQLVALGAVDHAVELVRTASCFGLSAMPSFQTLVPEDRRAVQVQKELFEPLKMLLECTPRITTPSDAAKGMASRSHWLRGFQALLNTDEHQFWSYLDKEVHARVRQLARVVAGDGNVLADITKDWMELLVATLLHVHPDAKPDRAIPQLLRECIRRKPSVSSRPAHNSTASHFSGDGAFWEELFLAAATGDTQEVVRLCSDNLSAWAMAHVTDLLGMASPSAARVVLAPLPGRWGVSQAEHYMLEYATSLCCLPSTWHVGAAYLRRCRTFGREVLDALLLRLPVAGDDRLAQKLLRFCDDDAREGGEDGKGPQARAAGICRVVAAHKWAAGQLAGAMSWWQQGGDSARLATVASLLLPQVTAAGPIALPPVLSPRGAGADARDKESDVATAAVARAQLDAIDTLLGLLTPDSALLAFVKKYCAFRRDMGAISRWEAAKPLKAQGGQGVAQAVDDHGATFEGTSVERRHADAGRAVEEMLVGRLAPRRFWMEILAEAVPLLEGPFLVFSAQVTSTLISLVEELAMTPLDLGGKGWGCAPAAGIPGTRPSSWRGGDGAETGRSWQLVVRQALVGNLSRAHLMEGM